MKFERNLVAERAAAAIIPGPGHTMYVAKAGDWIFQVIYDKLHCHWTATCFPRHPQPDGRYSSQQCEEPPEGQLMKTYGSQHEAEQACLRKYKQLRAAT